MGRVEAGVMSPLWSRQEASSSSEVWLRHQISVLELAEGSGLAGGPVGSASLITVDSGTQLFPSA